MIKPWALIGRTDELEAIGAAMRHVRGRAGVVLVGSPGVGKTRLAEELFAMASPRQTVRRVVASESARALPLGAFVEWLPTGTSDSMHAARAVIETLIAPTRGDSTVVIVDDAHLLDELSAFVVHQLVSRRLATTVLTVRSGGSAPESVTSLWKDGYLERIDVHPLSRPEMVRLVETALGGPLDPVAAQRMWHQTRGNVLYLRHLVEHERANSRLHLTERGWVWDQGPVVATSVVDLIVNEMGALPLAMVELLDTLAVAEPLDVRTLTQIVNPSVVEEAEARGLVVIGRGPSGEAARLSHPMYGEVRRARAGSMKLRRVRGRIATLLANTEGRRTVSEPNLSGAEGGNRIQDMAGGILDGVVGGGSRQVLRRAVLMLESDLDPDPAIFLEAAMEAMIVSDYQLAEQLSGRAGAGYEAKMVNLLALMQLWRAEDVEADILQLLSTDVDDEQRAQIDVIRALNLLLMLGRPEAAWDALDDAERKGHTAETQAAIMAVRALILAHQARPGDAIETATAALSLPQGFASDTIVALCSLLAGYGDRGRVNEVRKAASRGFEIGQYFWLAANLRFYLADLQQRYLLFAGYISESAVVVGQISEQFVDVPGNVQIWTTAYRAHAALGAGQLDSARRMLEQVLAGRQASRGWEYRYKHELAQTLAMMGKNSEAAVVLEGCIEESPASSKMAEPLFQISKAWVVASEGALTEAISRARAAADLARIRTQFCLEVVCLQAATQFGDLTTAPRLAELARVVEGPRAAIVSVYAQALANDDPEGLKDVSAQLEEMGDRVAATDASAHAAMAFVRADRRGSATICLERMRRLAVECGGVGSPAVRLAGAPSKLTRRQKEIIHLVSEGWTNKQIADRMQISVRTVEGHLYRAGIKTGAANRDELGRALRGE